MRGDVDFTLGCRHVPGEPMRVMDEMRKVATVVNAAHWVFTWLFNVTYGTRLRDPFTMYKVFRTECIEGVEFVADRFDFDWELAAKLVRLGYAPIEIPVAYNARSFHGGKKVRFFRDPPTWIAACLRFRFCSLPRQGALLDAEVRERRDQIARRPRARSGSSTSMRWMASRGGTLRRRQSSVRIGQPRESVRRCRRRPWSIERARSRSSSAASPGRSRRVARLVPDRRASPSRRSSSAAARSARLPRPPGTNGHAPFPGPAELPIARDFRPDRGASAWQSEPWAEVTHRAYADGELPLWNPYQGAGAPLAANMQSAVFDPLLLAVNLHPTPLTWDLSILGAFVLGAAAAYLFGRVLGLRVVAGGRHQRRVLSQRLVLPLQQQRISAARTSSCRCSSSWWSSRCAHGGGGPSSRSASPSPGNIYVGMPEASFFVIGPPAAYAAVRLVQERTRDAAPRLRSLGSAAEACWRLLLAAPLLLLFLQYESLSFNVHKSEFAKGSEADPHWGLLNWIVPFFQSPPRRFATSGTGSGSRSGSRRSSRCRDARRRSDCMPGCSSRSASSVLAQDLRLPGASIGSAGLPVLELVVFPVFAAPVVSFAFAVLAGIGVQVLWIAISGFGGS